jgi:hypothetical protein
MQNKIVARYQDGRVMKGVTSDFMPNKGVFHLVPMDAPVGSKPIEIHAKDLKAIFFVKDFVGNPNYKDDQNFDPSKPAVGRKIKVVFRDNETLIGTTQGYQPDRPGFFVVPCDVKSNSERCFVVSAATKEVSFM